MTQEFIFNAKLREKKGKGASRALRREGLIPASLYGDKKEPLAIAINPKELASQLSKSNLFSNIYTVKIADKNEEILIRDIQFHPVTDNPIHIDLLRVGANTITRLDVPVLLLNEGKCPGLKQGGTLNFIAHSLEVSCNPKNAPKSIELDLAQAKVGTVIKIEDIELPKGVKTYYPKGYPIYSITAPAATEDGKASAEE